MMTRDAVSMTRDERHREIAEILALGFWRLKQIQLAASTHTVAQCRDTVNTRRTP